MSKFQYQPRSAEQTEKRANQTGNQFVTYVKDEFITYSAKKENWGRILPPTWPGADHWGIDIWIHYNCGPQNATVLCLLKMKSAPCPMCEELEKARERGAAKEVLDNLKPSRRVVVWWLDRKEEQEGKGKGLYLWPMPWSLDRDISKVCRDRTTGETYQIDHPEAGYDITFDTEGVRPNIKYVGIQLARRQSPVADVHIEYAMAHQPKDCLLWRSYEEVKSLMFGEAPSTETTGAEEHPAAEIPVGSAPLPGGAFCDKWIMYRGEKMGCGLAAGHPGVGTNCDYDRPLSAPNNAADPAPTAAPPSAPAPTPVAAAPPPPPAPPPAPVFVSTWTGTNCSTCGKPQFTTPSGKTCEGGHAEVAPPPPQAAAAPPPLTTRPTPPIDEKKAETAPIAAGSVSNKAANLREKFSKENKPVA